MEKRKSILDFKEEVVIDDHVVLKGETISEYLEEFGFDVYFNDISNKYGVYYILNEDGTELENLNEVFEEDTDIRLCKEVVNYSFNDISYDFPWITYEDYKNEVIKEFLYEKDIDKSFNESDQLYLLYFCDEWISTSSIRVIGIYTEDVLKNKIIEEIKLNTVEYYSHEDPRDISLDALRDALEYISFDPIYVND